MQSSSHVSQPAETHRSSMSVQLKHPQQQHHNVVASADIHGHPSTSQPSSLSNKSGKPVQVGRSSGNITPTNSHHVCIHCFRNSFFVCILQTARTCSMSLVIGLIVTRIKLLVTHLLPSFSTYLLTYYVNVLLFHLNQEREYDF